MTNTDTAIRELGRRWTEAELAFDTAALDALSTADFTLVGPAGFVLAKQQWLGSLRSGALTIAALDWSDVQVRGYGGTAVAVGVRTQEGDYSGQPVNGRFRGTHIAVRESDGSWRMAGVHLSPMAALPA